MTNYVLSEEADRDLDSIWDYIAADNVDAAERWIGERFDAFDAIGDTPGIGHKREDLTPYPVLFWPVGAYHVIYRATSRLGEIVAVTQGSRDIPAFPAPPLFPMIHLPRRVAQLLIWLISPGNWVPRLRCLQRAGVAMFRK